MAGGEGSLRRRTAKSVEAAATGPQAPLRKFFSTKRKAGKEAAPTVPHASSKGSSTKRKAAKIPASCCIATGRKPEEEEATGAPVEEKCRRVSKADIRWILGLKPLKPPARLAALKRSNPELTPQPGEEADEDKRRLYRLAKAFFEMEENLPRTQEWVRSELQKKGYVELDEESAKRRAEVQAVIDQEWPAIEEKMKTLILSQKECYGSDGIDSGEDEDSDGSDDEEEEEEY